MLLINFLGLALNTLYISVYYIYTPKEELGAVWKQFGYTGAFVAAILAYAAIEDPAKIEFRFGIIIMIFLFTMVSAPLFGLVGFAFLNFYFREIIFSFFSVTLFVIRALKVYHSQWYLQEQL